MKKKRVFLGGTCNESTWRNRMMIYLHDAGIEYFNPVVDDWTEAHMEKELQERKTCDFCLYAITPKMKGVYSIAEVVDDSNKRPAKTVLVLLREDDGEKFSPGEWRSLIAVTKLVERNGGQVFESLKLAAMYMCDACCAHSLTTCSRGTEGKTDPAGEVVSSNLTEHNHIFDPQCPVHGG